MGAIPLRGRGRYSRPTPCQPMLWARNFRCHRPAPRQPRKTFIPPPDHDWAARPGSHGPVARFPKGHRYRASSEHRPVGTTTALVLVARVTVGCGCRGAARASRGSPFLVLLCLGRTRVLRLGLSSFIASKSLRYLRLFSSLALSRLALGFDATHSRRVDLVGQTGLQWRAPRFPRARHSVLWAYAWAVPQPGGLVPGGGTLHATAPWACGTGGLVLQSSLRGWARPA